MKKRPMSKLLHLVLPSALLIPSLSSAAISDTPLFVNTAVQPNIFFLLDDSGSMDWSTVHSNEAETIYSTLTQRQYNNWSAFHGEMNAREYPSSFDRGGILKTCVGFNNLYFNPNETYTPWEGKDEKGNLFVDQTITSARTNPYDEDSTVDLSSNYSGDYYYMVGNTWYYTTVNNARGYSPWTDDGDGVFEVGECPDPNDAGYDYNTDFVKVSDMSASQQANFANWYTYYRKREYVMKNAMLSIMESSSARLGFSTLHRNGTNGYAVADVTTGTVRDDIQKELLKVYSLNGTPLRSKFFQVGDYFEGTTSTDLFGSTQSTPILSAANGGTCQQNFAVVMSDGYWNGTAPSVGNADSGNTSDGDLNDTDFDGKSYADQNTGQSNTLADVAMHFYERDLDTSLDNDVPTSPLDGNNRQHLVTYSVAFGVDGTLNANPTDVDAAFNWPNVTQEDPTTIDDMRHAAWNGRGDFLSASSGSSLTTALNNAVASISGRTSSASSVATNSTRLQTNSKIYQARFKTTEWTGDLLAYNINSTTGAVTTLAWQAANQMPSENNRDIFTLNDSTSVGVAFEHANLSTSQQALLTSGQVDFLRGDRSNEGSLYRSRTSVLGDIVNSDPVFTGQEDFDYYALETVSGLSTYDDYLTGTDVSTKGEKGARPGMIYVGANDGMLHGLLGEGSTTSCTVGSGLCEGEEIFAYVPKAVYSNLASLSSVSYSHKYFVDNTPIIGDAYINFDGSASDSSGRWGSALVGTLAGGGRGIFALDVSNPKGFTAADVLWDVDYTNANSNGYSYDGLGYTFAKPAIVKLTTDTVGGTNSLNNDWGVIVGNGYESGQGAILYVLGLRTGEILWKKVVDSSSDNGLSTPIAVDTDGDKIADTVYAGDLKGNMWKFDISDTTDTNNWNIANSYKDKGTTYYDPLFTACTADPCTSSNYQPITSKPQVIRAESGGILVLFGTGKYYEVGDNTDTSKTQSFYGILDDGGTAKVTGRNALLQQTIIEEFSKAETGLNYNTRVTTNSSIDFANKDGWFLDLYFDKNPADSTNDNPGERVVADPLVRNGRVIFPTLIPDISPCTFGGTGYLMEINAQSGSRLEVSPFDLNDDGAINQGDWVMIDTDGDGTKDTKVPVSGKQSEVGIIKTPGVISTGDNELKYTSGSSGDIEVTTESSGDVLGRQSWIQIR